MDQNPLEFDPIQEQPAPEPAIQAGQFDVDPNLSFTDRGKIPQIVTELPEFHGDPRCLSEWIKDCEDILELYQDIQGSFQFYLIIKSIRRKVRGEANDILISNNTPTEWAPIKQVLCLYYADKRDLMTLDTQLKTMSRAQNEPIEIFYSWVREMMTLISSAIQTDIRWQDGKMPIIRLYNMMALDTFIRGLGEPLSLFCKNFKPENLAQAYHYCVEFQNLNMRNAPLRQRISNPPVPPPRGTAQFQQARINHSVPAYPYQLPQPRINQYLPKPIPKPRIMTPQPNQWPQNVNQWQAQRFAPNPWQPQQQPEPEPMEIDPSTRSRNINYKNFQKPMIPYKNTRPATASMQANAGPAPKRSAYQLEEQCGSSSEPVALGDNNQGEPSAEEYEEILTEFFEGQTEAKEREEINFLDQDTEWVSKWFD